MVVIVNDDNIQGCSRVRAERDGVH